MKKRDLEKISFIDRSGRLVDLLIDRLGFLDMKFSYGIDGLTGEEYDEYKRLLNEQKSF